MTHHKIQRLAIIAIASTFLAISSQLTIPFPLVPLTLQTLAIGIIATLLTPLDSVAAIFIYLLLGSFGLPVFAGGAAGFSVILGPTGGFLIGFLLQAQQTAQLNKLANLVKTPTGQITLFIITNLLGTTWCLVLGTAWLSISNHLPLQEGFKIGFIPFIIPGIIKAVLASFIGYAIRRALQNHRYFSTKARK